MEEVVNRRNISGIYIFHQFENEDTKKPTCFEDCSESKQDEWLNSLDESALKNLSKMLGNKLREICDKFDIIVD